MKSYKFFLFMIVFFLFAHTVFGQGTDGKTKACLQIGADIGVNPFSNIYFWAYDFAFEKPLQFSEGMNVSLVVKHGTGVSTVFKTGVLADYFNMPQVARMYYLGIPILVGHMIPVSDKRSAIFRWGLLWNTVVGDNLPENNNWPKPDEKSGWTAYTCYGNEWSLNDALSISAEIYWQHLMLSHLPSKGAFRPYDIFGITLGIGWKPKWF